MISWSRSGPAVELMLAEFMVEPEVSMKGWAKKVGTELRDRRVRHGTYTLKLMDAIDASANSLARAYAETVGGAVLGAGAARGRRTAHEQQSVQHGLAHGHV